MRSAFVGAAALFCVAGGARAGAVGTVDAEDNNVTVQRSDNPALRQAVAEAVRTLPIFWSKFDARTPGTDNYVVKLAMEAVGGGVEQLWAVPVKHSTGELVARIENEPMYVPAIHLGSVVQVSPNLISDWSYEKNGKLYGHFSTRVLLPSMMPQERAEIEADLAPTPLEP